MKHGLRTAGDDMSFLVSGLGKKNNCGQEYFNADDLRKKSVRLRESYNKVSDEL
jgi:hypothetical protein